MSVEKSNANQFQKKMAVIKKVKAEGIPSSLMFLFGCNA
jgi:hypothetical protein